MDKNNVELKARNKVIEFLIILVLLFAGLFATTSVYIIRCKKNTNAGDNSTATANGNIIVNEEHFTLELPSNWNGKYEYVKKAIGGADVYEFRTKSEKAELFGIIEAYTSLDVVPGRNLIKQVGSTYYYFSVPTDTPSESNEYAELAKSVEDEIRNSVKITDDGKEYDTAIAEIKKCLKDENWLKENNLKTNEDNVNVESNEKVYFVKLNSENNKPVFIVRTDVYDSSRLRIVSYDGSKVTVSGQCGTDVGRGRDNIKIDLNNNVVEIINGSVGSVTYYKIKEGKFELLESADPSGDLIDKEITELQEKFRKTSNFTEITTELTSQNIDTFIK